MVNSNCDIREKVQLATDIVSSARVSLEWITNEIQDEGEAGLVRSVTFVSAAALARAEALLDEVLGEMGD